MTIKCRMMALQTERPKSSYGTVQVSQRAGVVVVDLPGKTAAKWAGALGRREHRDDEDAVGRGQDLGDRQTCRDQR